MCYMVQGYLLHFYYWRGPISESGGEAPRRSLRAASRRIPENVADGPRTCFGISDGIIILASLKTTRLHGAFRKVPVDFLQY